ncbi:MAG: DNA translocase FtsK 4TM domain-containing protein [Alphaproteobacteria bacterium]|nr:DNA translocase FtsK 4TM domain-containing protein [Alphaproteobacteria bacterium]
MARSAQWGGRRIGAAARGSGEPWVTLKRFCYESSGAALVLASFLLLLGLLTYDRRDPSLDTAVATAPRNFLGREGAVLADLLMQTIGAAAYLIPLILLGWAFRLLLHRPLRNLPFKLGLLPLALLFATLALSVLDTGAMSVLPGGTVGWSLQRLLRTLGLGGVSLPIAMIAAALLGLLLLSIMGLSWRDWRELGQGAGRGAAGFLRLAGRGVIAAITLGQASFRRWRERRRAGRAAGGMSRRPDSRSTDLRHPDTRPRATVASLAERREPRLDPGSPVPTGTPAPAAAEQPPWEPDGAGRVVRFVMPRAKPLAPGKRAEQERQPALDLTPDEQPVLPPLDILSRPPAVKTETINEEALERNARLLEAVLEDFGVRGQIVQVRPGPVVTLYELEPAPGIKASRIIGLADDIARSMSAISVRVAVVPGRNVIGIELPNHRAETVYLRELLEAPAYENHGGKLSLILGKDIGGEPVIADLARMPHLLIAGTTGSGKSVGINTMILSILYRMPPDRCKFIMVDPKMLELSVYDDIPHLLAPVVTDPKKAVMALKWTVREMENRYRKMSKLGVRNIEGYNARLVEAQAKGENLVRKVQTGFDPETGQPIFEEQPFDTDELPFIIVVVDEMADLMLVAGKEIEAAIQRLAQMARAAGIHIIMATQRPSVDVITGTIKANFPTRVSFQVTSKIDSRTILGEGGAEQLLGRGDMLYMAGGGRITRVHGPFVSDDEVERVVSFLKTRRAPDYIDEITEDSGPGADPLPGEEESDASNSLYDQAVALVCRERKASTSFVQRHLQIGYNRAARIIERMEAEGVVSRANHVGKREVLARSGD